jgi:hypothetical protein
VKICLLENQMLPQNKVKVDVLNLSDKVLLSTSYWKLGSIIRKKVSSLCNTVLKSLIPGIFVFSSMVVSLKPHIPG